MTKLPLLYVALLRYRVAAMVALFMLLGAARLGRRGVALLGVALVVSQIYSARPVRLSYRAAGAPLALGIAYVIVPYSLGIVAAGGSVRHAWSELTCGLFLLFAARILLKDFRDREGDARYGKPTILLRFGKTATCAASLCALVAGDAVLSVALEPSLVAFVQPFVLAMAWMLWRLWRADDGRAEQVAIGLGARMGNGLLLGVLAWLLVVGRGASIAEASVLTGAVSALFFLGFATLAAHPQQVVIGCKG